MFLTVSLNVEELLTNMNKSNKRMENRMSQDTLLHSGHGTSYNV